MRTLRMVALYDSVPMGQLVEQLDELEARPRAQWSPRAELQHQSIEGAVVQRILDRAVPAGIAVECALEVKVHARGKERDALVTALERGGARLAVEGAWAAGTGLQVATPSTRVAVQTIGPLVGGVKISFLKPRTATAEQRLHALVRAALRARPPGLTSRRRTTA